MQNSGYATKTFSEFVSTVDRGIEHEKTLLLRHDVDADMEAALNLALIEHELGVKSTYFFMTQSPVYNVFSRRNMQIVDRIYSMSHEIGLHSDVCDRHANQEDIFADINNEIISFSKMIEIKINSVSFHQPTLNGLNHTTDYMLDGYISAYNEARIRKLKYISDSNRKKSVSQITEECLTFAEENQGIGVQLLIHPMWWIYDEATTDLVWDRVIEENLIATQEQLLATEKAFGNRRKFKIIADE